MKTLIVCSALLCSTAVMAQNAPMIVPRCDAEIVVENWGQGGKEEWFETIQILKDMGALDERWASELRQLVEEASTLQNASQRQEWLQQKCSKE